MITNLVTRMHPLQDGRGISVKSGRIDVSMSNVTHRTTNSRLGSLNMMLLSSVIIARNTIRCILEVIMRTQKQYNQCQQPMLCQSCNSNNICQACMEFVKHHSDIMWQINKVFTCAILMTLLLPCHMNKIPI